MNKKNKTLADFILSNQEHIANNQKLIGKNQDEIIDIQKGFTSMLKMIQDLALEIKKIK